MIFVCTEESGKCAVSIRKVCFWVLEIGGWWLGREILDCPANFVNLAAVPGCCDCWWWVVDLWLFLKLVCHFPWRSLLLCHVVERH